MKWYIQMPCEDPDQLDSVWVRSSLQSLRAPSWGGVLRAASVWVLPGREAEEVLSGVLKITQRAMITQRAIYQIEFLDFCVAYFSRRTHQMKVQRFSETRNASDLFIAVGSCLESAIRVGWTDNRRMVKPVWFGFFCLMAYQLFLGYLMPKPFS